MSHGSSLYVISLSFTLEIEKTSRVYNLLELLITMSHYIYRVNYTPLPSKILELHSPPLKSKVYIPLPYKMLELQHSPLIIKYALQFNLF